MISLFHGKMAFKSQEVGLAAHTSVCEKRRVKGIRLWPHDEPSCKTFKGLFFSSTKVESVLENAFQLLIAQA